MPAAAPMLPAHAYKLYTAREAAKVLQVSENWLTAARKAGAPFPGGRTRPEWMLDWLQEHPEFTLKEHQ